MYLKLIEDIRDLVILSTLSKLLSVKKLELELELDLPLFA